MKRAVFLFLVLTMFVSLCACGSTAAQATPAPTSGSTSEPVPPADEAVGSEAAVETPEASGSDILVLYFSRTGEQYNVGVIEKGNTAIVAEIIGEATGADLYEILPADDHYPMTYKDGRSPAGAAGSRPPGLCRRASRF